MAKHDTGTTRKTSRTASKQPTATKTDSMEQRATAFAQQVGRIAGTLHTKAEGWLAGGATTKAANKKPAAAAKKPVAPAVHGENRGRSGGVVDAPGKKHRQPMPSDPDAILADRQAAKMRAVTPMAKTNRRRGRA